MAEYREQNSTRIITKDGLVTATIVENLSPDRLALMLAKGQASARVANYEDNTPVVSRSVKDIVLYPFTEF